MINTKKSNESDMPKFKWRCEPGVYKCFKCDKHLNVDNWVNMLLNNAEFKKYVIDGVENIEVCGICHEPLEFDMGYKMPYWTNLCRSSAINNLY